MLKRVLLAFTFVAAIGVAGLGFGKKATAWHCDDDYYYGYPVYYSSYYAPRVVYYRSYPVHHHRGYYRGHHGRHHHRHDYHRSGLSISFGF